MKTILAMGQSNAVGRADGGGWNIPASVTVWNNTNDLEDLTALGTAFTAANRAAAPFVNSKNNMFVHAAKYLAQLTGEPVRLILVAKGGLPISKWDGKTSPMYARMVAVLAAAGVTKVDAFLWHQGENDAVDPALVTAYTAKWQALLANLESDGFIDAETPVVLGEVSPESNAINPVLHGLTDLRTDIAPLKTLETYDNVHFKATALIEAGFMYARRAWALLPETAPVVVEYPNGAFVSASGFGSLTVPNSTDTKVPVAALYGDTGMIDTDGSFKAPFAGVFRFMLQGYSGKGMSRVKLLDEALQELRFVAYAGAQDPGANNSILSGWCDVELPQGAKVWLGVQQTSGASATVDAQSNPIYNKMSVTVLRRALPA